MTVRARLPGLDGLRGLAALGVVAVHVWMYTENSRPDHWRLLDLVIGELRVGLVYFFVASGFLLARPWVRAALDDAAPPRLSRFARHRAARVLPAYLVALIGAFLVLQGTGHSREVGWEQLPIFAVFAQNQVPATAGELNPPTWSLAVEAGFYLLLPLLGWMFLRAATRTRMLAICALAIAAGCGWCAAGWLGGWPETVMTSPPTFAAVFVCGVATCVVAYGRTVSPRLAVGLLLTGWSLVLANSWWHAGGDTGVIGHTLRDVPAAIGFGAITVGLVARPPGLLDFAPVRRLGEVSYGLYLWHMPVLYLLRTHDAFPQGFAAAYALVALPAIVLGAGSWLLVERPILRAASRRRAPGAPRRRLLAWRTAFTAPAEVAGGADRTP